MRDIPRNRNYLSQQGRHDDLEHKGGAGQLAQTGYIPFPDQLSGPGIEDPAGPELK